MNKKLLKSIVCIASGMGFAASIPFAATSCGCSSEDVLPSNVLPESVYKFSEDDKTLLGFQDAFLNDSASPIYKDKFQDCDTMEIPAKVTSISESAFYKDSATTIPEFITKLTFEEDSNCSFIGNLAFEYSPLTTVSLSNKLSSINNYAFAGCSKLNSIDLSKATSLQLINTSAFYNCRLLTSIDLSHTDLIQIGQGAFYDCYKLESVKFPDSLESFGISAFYYCSELTSIILPSALKIIDSGAFQNCRSLHSIDFSNCTNLSTINDGTFYYCSKLTSIDLSNATDLTTIGNNVFGSCSELTSVTFPSSLITIKSNVFQECSRLNDIKWKSWTGNTNLSSTSFSGVSQTRGTVTVTNPSGHDSDELLNYLLENGGLPETWAKDAVKALPEEVYDIDEGTNQLKGFKDEFLNDPDSEIYKDKFQDCNTMQIPAKVTSITDNAFLKNSATTIPPFITKLTFAEGSKCTSIGEYSFAAINDSPLISATFPSSLESIGQSAFLMCKSLNIANLSNCNNLSSIGENAFFFCSALTSVDLSHTNLMKTIHQNTFSQCKRLSSVKLPNNLQTIEESAFLECNFLTSISFPSSLTTISGGNTFNGCTTLNSIAWDLPNNYETSISIDINTFSFLPSSGTVRSLNTSIASSQQLLEFLQTKGKLPADWKIAK